MKVTNPTDSDISVQIEGIVYSIEAGSSIDNVPAKHAEDWKTRTHNFIQIKDDSVASPAVSTESIETPKAAVKSKVNRTKKTKMDTEESTPEVVTEGTTSDEETSEEEVSE